MVSAKACRKCAVPLVLGDNWVASSAKFGNYVCNPCLRAYNSARQKRIRKTTPKVPQIYVLENPEIPGMVKVGRLSRNPILRLAHYNTGHPNRAYRFAVLVPVGDAGAAEAEAHRLLAPYHHSHEWFACPTKVAVAVVSALL